MEHLVKDKYSPKSISSYQNAVNRFISFLTARSIHRLADVTPCHLAGYRRELAQQGYAGQSIHLYLRTVRKLFAYLEQQRQIFINPAHSLVIPTGKANAMPVPTKAQINHLLTIPDITSLTGIRDRAILETLYSTGVRLSELIALNLGDIDLKQDRLTVKGLKKRVLHPGKPALPWLNRYIRQARPALVGKRLDEDALFLGARGKRINPLIVERAVKHYGEKAGITVNAGILRRAYAVHALERGVHPAALQLVLGHANLKSLGRFLTMTITDMHKKGFTP